MGAVIASLDADENGPEERGKNDDNERKMGELMEHYL